MMVLGLAGCAGERIGVPGSPKPDADAAVAGGEAAAEPVGKSLAVTPAPPPPPANARTVEEFDTMTAAVAPPPSPAQAEDGQLGTTIASLGAADEPGFWIKTPLARERKPGRLFYAASGRSVQVQLIPSGGPSGGGSQVSLAAMRLMGAPLTGLPEIVVYEN